MVAERDGRIFDHRTLHFTLYTNIYPDSGNRKGHWDGCGTSQRESNNIAKGRALVSRGGPGMFSLDQFVVWLIIGLLGGSLAGLIIKRERKGFGALRNLGLGLAGAFVGGLLFRLFGLLRGLDQVTISLRDVVAAVVGSLLVLAALWLWQRWHRST